MLETLNAPTRSTARQTQQQNGKTTWISARTTRYKTDFRAHTLVAPTIHLSKNNLRTTYKRFAQPVKARHRARRITIPLPESVQGEADDIVTPASVNPAALKNSSTVRRRFIGRSMSFDIKAVRLARHSRFSSGCNRNSAAQRVAQFVTVSAPRPTRAVW